MRERSIGILFVLVLLGGVGAYILAQQGQTTVGPCVHRTGGPILSVTAVTDAETGERVSSFSLHNITRPSGHPVRSPASCTGSCGFGRQAGNWSFTVRADGYEPRSMTVPAEYHNHEGGCPSYASNGTTITVSLEPE